MEQKDQISNKGHKKLIGSKRIIDVIWILAFVFIIVLYLVLSYIGNTDLTAGRFALFMDERITFDGVRHILHPSSITDWILSVVHGGDHRYGRSLWNSIAIFSFIPERIWGESGQIVADRMAQVFILLTAYSLFAMSFLKSWFMRFMLMAVLLVMPYTSYFMSMPKPEPLQLLFIGFFLYFYNKNEFSLKAPYWVLLGLAFGTKISTLPLIPVLLMFAYTGSLDKKNISKYFEDALTALFWFLIGLCFAVPILAGHIIISIALYMPLVKYIPKLRKQFGMLYDYAVIIAIGILNIILTLALYKAGIKSGLTTWLGSTILNTAHGSDRPEIWLGSWMQYFVTDWMEAPPILVIILLALFVAYFIASFAYESGYYSQKINAGNKFPAAILLSGFVLNVSIMVTAHRLWGLYLFPGTVLIVVGAFILLEKDFVNFRNDVLNFKLNVPAYLACTSFSLILFTVCIWWMPKSISDYKALSCRTNTYEYKTEYQSYIKINEFLADYSKQAGRRLNVLADPWLFLPESSNRYEIKAFLGPFTQWGDHADVIIFSSQHTAKRANLPINAPNYKSLLLERDGYNKYVINQNEVYRTPFCYRKSTELPNGGEVLTLVTQ